MPHLRKPHVFSGSPIVKAQKFENIIQLNRLFQRNDSILEYDTYGGGIANYFVHKKDMPFHITTIGLVDSKILKEKFQLVDGIAYLAAPNRWMLIEPHYQLIFLSWLPKKYHSKYLKKMRNIDFYDCEPLERKQFEDLFDTVGLSYQNHTTQALRIFLNDEKDPHKALYFQLFLIFFIKIIAWYYPHFNLCHEKQ